MFSQFWAFVEGGQYQNLKLFLLDLTGLGRDALHVHIGLAVFVAVRLCWRWRGGWILAWLAALAAALAGEWLDLRGEYAIGVPQPDNEHWHDIWNTMLWPTILLLLGRWLHPRSANAPNEDEIADSGDLADQSLEQPPSV